MKNQIFTPKTIRNFHSAKEYCLQKKCFIHELLNEVMQVKKAGETDLFPVCQTTKLNGKKSIGSRVHSPKFFCDPERISRVYANR